MAREGTLRVPDPNWFGGADRDRHARTRTGAPCRPSTPMPTATTAIIGVADMAHAIRSGRPHRASGDLAFHVLEVMEAFQRSSDEERHRDRHREPAGAAGDAADGPEAGRIRLSWAIVEHGS